MILLPKSPKFNNDVPIVVTTMFLYLPVVLHETCREIEVSLSSQFPSIHASLLVSPTYKGALMHVTKVANENPHKTSQFLLPFTTFEMPPPTLFLLMLTKSSSDSLLQPPGVHIPTLYVLSNLG